VKADDLQGQLKQVLISMVESEFAFFEMQEECGFINAAELCQSCFRKSPEVLYTIDMVRSMGKFALFVFDSIFTQRVRVHAG
jgi:hypothetical protein